MPIIKSAKKRVRTARKATIRNSRTRRSLKTALKIFAGSPTTKTHAGAQSNLDKAVKKGIIHKNKAARLNKKAAAKAKAAGVKAAAKAAKKAAPKRKPAAKKSHTKKK